MPQRKSPDVLIIGAGFAGAIVARELRMAGLSSTILEARDRIGGRTFTATWLGEVIELGGHYVHWYTLSHTHTTPHPPPPLSQTLTNTHTHTLSLSLWCTRPCASRTQPHIWAEMTRYGAEIEEITGLSAENYHFKVDMSGSVCRMEPDSFWQVEILKSHVYSIVQGDVLGH
jgi:monoamine oxidase